MIVVSDTSPIINLAAIGQLDLLRQRYQRVLICETVAEELKQLGPDQPGADAMELDWIEVRSIHDKAQMAAELETLDAGEAETIVLALESHADWTLMDERRGRERAVSLGLRVVGLLGVLLDSKRSGLITEIKPLLQGLQDFGFFIRPALVAEVLELAGEK
ncbi:MAG: DUF3368 domain-containing protein [Planctomycetaceae bacterium]